MHGILSFGTWLNMFSSVYTLFTSRYFKRLILVLYGAARLLFTLQNVTERFLMIKMGNYCK